MHQYNNTCSQAACEKQKIVTEQLGQRKDKKASFKRASQLLLNCLSSRIGCVEAGVNKTSTT